MKIQSELIEPTDFFDLKSIDECKKYLNQLEMPINVFSKEYRQMREHELEMIRHIQMLELLEKYNAEIKQQLVEIHYYMDSINTLKVIIDITFNKKKTQKEFEKELNELRSIRKRKLRKLRK